MKRFQHLILMILCYFYSTVSACSLDELTSVDLPLRDPFSLPALTHCNNASQNASPLSQWAVLGIIGRQNRWQSWLTNETDSLGNEKQSWLMLKIGDLLPDSELEVSLITTSSIEFNSRANSITHCDDSLPLKLDFQS